LYGSVGAPEIVKALKQHEVTITPDQVRLKGPLKELGLYTVDVHLGQEIESQLKVWVVPTVGETEPATESKAEGQPEGKPAGKGETKSAGKKGESASK
jgi:large subunit ribosomal protein L9